MDGILLVDKPKSWTSFDVVAKVRGIIKRETGLKKPKVGHTGTLDPLATGLLVLLLGSYTKKAPELSKLDKNYEVTMKLGQTSTTGDAEGVITVYKFKRSLEKVNFLAVREVLESFVGEITQVPPAYSAIKINGQRAYKLAREGKEVKLEPRKVKIYEITDVEYKYPTVKFTTKVCSGTYIRSLVEDIGKELGTGAYMTDLRRAQVGSYSLENAVNIKDLSSDNIAREVLTA